MDHGYQPDGKKASMKPQLLPTDGLLRWVMDGRTYVLNRSVGFLLPALACDDASWLVDRRWDGAVTWDGQLLLGAGGLSQCRYCTLLYSIPVLSVRMRDVNGRTFAVRQTADIDPLIRSTYSGLHTVLRLGVLPTMGICTRCQRLIAIATLDHGMYSSNEDSTNSRSCENTTASSRIAAETKGGWGRPGRLEQVW